MNQLSDRDSWSFPLRDLARRRFQTLLTMLSLIVCVSVTIFLVLFGQNLGVQLFSVSGEGLTFGFSSILYTFILVVVVLNSVTGIVIAYFLISLATSDRVRDIGIMKAIGCLTDKVFSYFSTELAIIVFVGCGVGTVLGIVLDFASVGLLGIMGYQISAAPLDPLIIGVVFFSFAFVCYILGMRRIIKASSVEPAKALSPIYLLKTARQPFLAVPKLRLSGFLAKMALRGMGRRRAPTLQSVACLALVVSSTTLAVVGGVVANETSQSYVERAIGSNVVLVAEAELAENYIGLLSRFQGSEQTEPLDYLDQKYAIPSTVISNLSTISGVVTVDPRLILETTVYEKQAIIPNPDEPTGYVVIGDERNGEALIVGANAGNLVSDWLIFGESLNETSPNDVLLGDSLALGIFQKPLVQSLGLLNLEFGIAGICLDPLNGGNVVYMSFSRLSQMCDHAGYNLLLLQVASSPSSRSEVISEIENRVSGTRLVVRDLNGALGMQKAFLSRLWSLLLSLSLLSFVNAVLSLMGYLALSISAQGRDFGIMRALGTKPASVMKVILLETFLLVSAGAAVGLPIGLVVAFWFFIPESIVSLTAASTIAVLLSVLIAALCLTSLYPARKMAKMAITSAMSRF